MIMYVHITIVLQLVVRLFDTKNIRGRQTNKKYVLIVTLVIYVIDDTVKPRYKL